MRITKIWPLALQFVVLGAICGSSSLSSTTGVTTKIEEKRDQDGVIRSRIETVSRGQEKVMQVAYSKIKDKLQITSRSYLVGGDLVMIESDEEGKGSLETLTLFNPKNDDMEVFERQPNGTVEPISSEKLVIMKQMKIIQDELGEKMAEGNLKPEEVEKLIEDTRAKIQQLHKRLQELK